MVITHSPRCQNSVSRLRIRRRNIQSFRHKSDTGRVDQKSAVSLHDFGIPCNNPHACFLCCLRETVYDSLEQGNLKPLLQNKSACQILRHSASHKKIIDRAAHAEPADISSPKNKRRNDETVCRHRNPAASGHHRAVLHPAQRLIPKRRRKDFSDQLAGRLTAASVFHCNSCCLNHRF